MFQLSSKKPSRRAMWLKVIAITAITSLFSVAALAAGGSSAQDLGAMATSITNVFPAFVKLVVAISYVAGIGFAAAGIMKFKQHKDNPTQVPLGGPIAMIFIAAALIYLPTIIQSTGATVFGSANAAHGGTSGVDPFGS